MPGNSELVNMRALERANAIPVVLVNTSGDVVNPGGVVTDVDIRNLNPGQDTIGVTGAVGITGDVNVSVTIGDVITVGAITAPMGVSGDVSTTPKSGQTWPVSIAATLNVAQQGQIGAQIAGGQIGVTGDIILQQSSDRIIGRVAGPLGVQIVGGSGIGTSGVTGDVTVKPVAGQTFPVTQSGAWSVAGSGDVNLVDGVTRSVKSTVRDYANSNPLAVVLTNASGDSYDSSPLPPPLETKAGIASWAGSYILASAAAGKRLYVTNYDFQAQADFGYAHFAAGASGSQLTPQWIFGVREGVAKEVSPYGSGYLFRTGAGGNLSLENAGNNVRFSVGYFTGDA